MSTLLKRCRECLQNRGDNVLSNLVPREGFICGRGCTPRCEQTLNIVNDCGDCGDSCALGRVPLSFLKMETQGVLLRGCSTLENPHLLFTGVSARPWDACCLCRQVFRQHPPLGLSHGPTSPRNSSGKNVLPFLMTSSPCFLPRS